MLHMIVIATSERYSTRVAAWQKQQDALCSTACDVLLCVNELARLPIALMWPAVMLQRPFDDHGLLFHVRSYSPDRSASVRTRLDC